MTGSIRARVLTVRIGFDCSYERERTLAMSRQDGEFAARAYLFLFLCCAQVKLGLEEHVSGYCRKYMEP